MSETPAFDATPELAAAILDASACATLLLDPKLEIRYLNTAALKALQEVQAALPFRAGEASGKSFALICDAAQLRDRSQLPWSTQIELGDARIELDARALYLGGDYLGPLLSWTRAREAEVAEAEQIRDWRAQSEAIWTSQLVIEFTTEGMILDVNELFLSAVGYAREELVGRHHGILVDAEFRSSAEYKQFWRELATGRTQQGEFRRRDKTGRDVWLQAHYTPITNAKGEIRKIIKYASDITAQKVQTADSVSQLTAISRAMGVIEFEMDGTVRNANANFLAMIGYTAAELVGRHHRVLVESTYANSEAYREFWASLNAGEFESGEFLRIGKDGREIWIQASYNPVLDFDGRPYKVVKYATDITEQKRQAAEIRRLSEAAQRDAHELQARVNEMLDTVAAAAEGDLTQTLDDAGDDALAQMARGLGRLFGDLRRSIGSIAEHASDVGAASNQLTSLSQQMAATADETSAQVQVVNEAAADVSSNVATVAAGIEELGASMRDISKNATEAAKIATRGVAVAGDTNASVAELGESGQEIGKIVKLITSIAQQTNLLALNATIEAARAGEAGRGFAVVANEVKELAKETSTATDEISQRILAIQKRTDAAVTAIAQISDIIERINEFQSAIAAAVEQQSATTSSISRNISEAARRSSEIADNITTVATAAKNTAGAAGDTQNAANQLDGMANSLQKLVAAFNL